MAQSTTRAAVSNQVSNIEWGPIFAGAAAAAALAFVLHSFAIAVGLSVSSTAPTWRDASIALWILSGLYLLLVALAAYGLGGYLAGRARSDDLVSASPEEVEIRDGGHGLLVWAIATIATVLLTLWTSQALTPLASPAGGQAGPATSIGGENIIAYDLDRLFRSERPPPNIDMNYSRAEASRILLTVSGHGGIRGDDRAHLVRLTERVTGLAPADAERRVGEVIREAESNISRARGATLFVGFMSGAAALLGAAVAWLAACAGGRQRGSAIPTLSWGNLGRKLSET